MADGKLDETSLEVFYGIKEGAPVYTVLDKQVGGSHYKDCEIQPIEYIHRNRLGFCEGNIVKYITRHHQKGGRNDILKVIHYAELLLELEYGTDVRDSKHSQMYTKGDKVHESYQPT